MPIRDKVRSQTEFDYLITPDGLIYDWHDINSPVNDGRWLLTFEGQGMPEINYITQRGPFQHGITVLDFRFGPRTISYLHHRSACNRMGYWDVREELIEYCGPDRQVPNTPFKLGALSKVRPDGSTRNIDVTILSGPYGNPRSLDRWRELGYTETLKWLAPDPAFYDPTLNIVPLTIDACSDLVFPFEFPFIFCGDSLSVINSITYTGNWFSYPIINFTGPWDAGAFIVNVTTNRKLQFTRAIPAGTTVTIDTRYGKKTVTDHLGNSWRGSLTGDSNLSWFLLHAPGAPGGVNVISAGGTGGVPGVSKVELQYYTRFKGM